MTSTGELVLPIDAGVIQWSDLKADFLYLCKRTHAGRQSEDEITLCKNMGGAHLDLFTARFLGQRLQSAKR